MEKKILKETKMEVQKVVKIESRRPYRMRAKGPGPRRDDGEHWNWKRRRSTGLDMNKNRSHEAWEHKFHK